MKWYSKPRKSGTRPVQNSKSAGSENKEYMAKRKTAIESDIYTALLALAGLAVLSTAAFVAVMFAAQYGTISNLFKISQIAR